MSHVSSSLVCYDDDRELCRRRRTCHHARKNLCAVGSTSALGNLRRTPRRFSLTCKQARPHLDLLSHDVRDRSSTVVLEVVGFGGRIVVSTHIAVPCLNLSSHPALPPSSISFSHHASAQGYRCHGWAPARHRHHPPRCFS